MQKDLNKIKGKNQNFLRNKKSIFNENDKAPPLSSSKDATDNESEDDNKKSSKI
jgi:hypothetical protein